jgi:ABC-type uncharacterized transport system substrate-binding protein
VKRRALLASLALAPWLARAQGKVARVGMLSGRAPPASIDASVHGAFVRGMRELGYVEGRNVRYEWRFAGGDYGELRRMADELARLKVDVIVTEGTSSTVPARQATSTIPIVMSTSSDPVGSGFIASLARPGGNVTGLTSSQVEATLKRLELLTVVVPGLKRAAMLTNPRNLAHTEKMFLHEAQLAAQKFNVRVAAVRASTPAEIEEAFSAMTREKAEALIVLPDALFNTQRRQIVGLAAQARIPAIYSIREYLEAGGLLVYGHDIADMNRRAATYVDKILKGAKPAELPVEQPSQFELLVNLKTAKALGITIPERLLIRANEVIR